MNKNHKKAKKKYITLTAIIYKLNNTKNE